MAKSKQIKPKVDKRSVDSKYINTKIYSKQLKRNILIEDNPNKFKLYDSIGLNYIYQNDKIEERPTEQDSTDIRED